MGKTILEEFKDRLVPQPNRDIGIEIEMEGRGLVKGPRGWDTTTDGSLRGESLEWVLSRPVTVEDSFILLDRLQTHLKEYGSKLIPSDRCGVHIHINCQDMSVDKVMRFAVLYLVLEDLLVKWCGEDREGNLFCMRAQDAESIMKYLIEASHLGTFKKLVNKDIRYASINFQSLSKYGSLEFRALRTPSDFNVIKTWIKMLMSIKKASSTYKSTEEIIELISMRGGRHFLKSVFGSEANELLPLGKINDTILTAARRVQDVAYAERYKPKKKEGLEAMPYEYWSQLKNAIKWCKGNGYEFVNWNPYTSHIVFIYERQKYPQTWAMITPAEELPEESSIKDWDHQHNMALIYKKISELTPVYEEEEPEWEPEEDEYVEIEEEDNGF